MLSLALIYFLAFGYLASKNFKTAVCYLIIFLPSYFIRFNIGPLPTTLLEVSFLALFSVWLVKFAKEDFVEIKNFCREKKWLSIAVVLFFIFSLGGIIASPEIIKSLGIWRAYFLEPILFFVILIGRRKMISRDDLIRFLSISTISISALAIIQKLTGQLYSPTLTGRDIVDLQGRVTSFFTTPNAIGLFLAPIVPLMIYGFSDKSRKKYYIFICGLALVAIALSVSIGAWLGLMAGGLVALCLWGKRKIVVSVLIAGLIVMSIIKPVRQNLLLQNPSGQIRLKIWSYTWNYVSESPKNFIFGAGLRQWFEKVQKPVNDFTKIEPLIYPHNIILNFWSEIGLLGMISFVILFFCAVHCANLLKNKNKFLAIALISSLVIFMVHGLVDVPYFKNDLAFLWWVILAILAI